MPGEIDWRKGGEGALAKVLCDGARYLTDEELLGAFFGFRSSEKAREFGRAVLERVSLAELPEFTAEELQSVKGVGPVAAARLLSAVELSRRTLRQRLPEKHPGENIESLSRYLYARYGKKREECLGAVFFGRNGEILAECEFFRGDRRRVTVDASTVIRKAITLGSRRVLIFHNHPGGSLTPSVDDMRFAEHFSALASGFDIYLSDFLILSPKGSSKSLRTIGGFPIASAGAGQGVFPYYVIDDREGR